MRTSLKRAMPPLPGAVTDWSGVIQQFTVTEESSDHPPTHTSTARPSTHPPTASRVSQPHLLSPQPALTETIIMDVVVVVLRPLVRTTGRGDAGWCYCSSSGRQPVGAVSRRPALAAGGCTCVRRDAGVVLVVLVGPHPPDAVVAQQAGQALGEQHRQSQQQDAVSRLEEQARGDPSGRVPQGPVVGGGWYLLQLEGHLQQQARGEARHIRVRAQVA